MHQSRGKWWHVTSTLPRKWTDLGPDRDRALDYYHQLESGTVARGSVAELLDEYLKAAKSELSAKTFKDYSYAAKALKNVFGRMPVGAVTSGHVGQYLDKHPRKVAANRQVAVLSSAYSKALRWGWVTGNPCQGIKRNSERPRPRLVTVIEYSTVYKTMPGWIQCMMDISYLTSLRQGDILDLLDDEADKLTVVSNKTKYGQEFEINSVLRNVLLRARSLKKPEVAACSLLFPTRKGTRYTIDGFQSIWQRYLKKSGVKDFHFHDIRAKSLTDADTMGLDASIMAGHHDPKTTERYIKVRRIKKVTPHGEKL